MALTRPISVDLWLKQDVNESYSLDDKLVYVYLITNEHTQQLGIYRITFKTIANELNMPLDRVEQSMFNLENKFNIIRYSKRTNEVAILDYLTFGILKGGNVIRQCFNNINKKVQDKTLLASLYIYSKQFKSDLPMYNEALELIRQALSYGDNELASMDNFQKPMIDYFYDSDGYRIELGPKCYDDYCNVKDSEWAVKVKCYDDKYRYVEVYNTGNQEKRYKNENTEYILCIDKDDIKVDKNLTIEDIVPW